MKYRIKRLPAPDKARRYHLYDDQQQILLVADHGSPWLPGEPYRHVRFALPDGQPLASLDLPQSKGGRGREKVNSYAVIYNHAVYAIFNEHGAEEKGLDSLPYYVIEVEGERWLALGSSWKAPLHWALYDTIPPGLSLYEQQVAADLPEPVGRVQPDPDAHEFLARLPGDRLQQGPLLLLALVFLFERLLEKSPHH